MKKATHVLLAITTLFFARVAPAQQLEQIPEEHVRKLAPMLIEQANKLESKIKIDADVEKANGYHLPMKLGAVIVPQKELKESAELAAKFQTDTGAPLGYLFFYHLVPVVDGKKIDTSKLKTVTITANDGTEHSIYVMTVAVRQPAADDYRLHVYGAEPKPLVDSKFAAENGTGPEPVALELKDPNEATKEGTVVITVFGKYQAKFQAAFVE